MDNQKFLKELYESLKSMDDYPIDYAAENGYLEVVKWLHLNTDEPCTTHAMNYAASNGHFEIVKFLYEKILFSCCIEEAIEIAAEEGHTEIVKFLYQYIHKDYIDEITEFINECELSRKLN